MTIPANNTNSVFASDNKVAFFFRIDPTFGEPFDNVLIITQNNGVWDEGPQVVTPAYNSEESTEERAAIFTAYVLTHGEFMLDTQFGNPAPRPDAPALSELLAKTKTIDLSRVVRPVPTTWEAYVPYFIANYGMSGFPYTLGPKTAPKPAPQPAPTGDIRWGPRWFHLGRAIEAGEDRATGDLAIRVNNSNGWQKWRPE